MARTPIPTWFFAVVIVRRDAPAFLPSGASGRKDDRFLLVQERKHGQLWYFPAGRVEPGETLAAAARRETLEESGVPVELDGILRIEHSVTRESARVRVLYTAHPVADTPPKSVPDAESLGAAWVSLEDLDRLPLRGHEVARVLADVARGAPVYPLSLISFEGAPLLA